MQRKTFVISVFASTANSVAVSTQDESAVIVSLTQSSVSL